MCHVTHMNESCHTYAWVMSHTGMSRVTYMNESCQQQQLLVYHFTHFHLCYTHTQISHVTYTNQSSHEHESVMSHIESCHKNHSFLRHKKHKYTVLWGFSFRSLLIMLNRSLLALLHRLLYNVHPRHQENIYWSLFEVIFIISFRSIAYIWHLTDMTDQIYLRH